MLPQHLQLTSASLCSLFHKWYGVKNCEINFCRWIGVNDDEFWEEFSDSVVQMLCEFGKRKLQPTDNQLTAILLCCLGRIRTLTGGTRIRRATITPQGNLLRGIALPLLRVQSYNVFLICARVVWFFWKIFLWNFRTKHSFGYNSLNLAMRQLHGLLWYPWT